MAERLRTCQLAVAFKLDEGFRHLSRPRPAALLGQVSHDLAERAHRGDFRSESDPRAAATQVWSQLIEEAEAVLSAEWDQPVPPAARWPGYQLVRIRAIRRAAELSVDRDPDATPRRDSRRSSQELEQTLRDQDTRLYGRPDRVTRHGDTAVIHDLKSGWSQPAEVSPRQKRQLLFYSHLWRAEHGVLPARAEIETGDGTAIGFDVTEEDVDALVADVLTARKAFNRASGTTEPESLATPTPGNCRFCDFRPVCGPHLSSVTDEWDWSATRAGWVRGVHEGSDGMSLELDLAFPEQVRGSRCRVTRVTSQADMADAFVVIVDAEPTASPAQIRSRWDTVIEPWGEQ